MSEEVILMCEGGRLDSDHGLSDREILEEEAIVNWISTKLSTRQIIDELMSLSARMALDPRVSQAAADLYHEGYLAGSTGSANRLKLDYETEGQV